MLQRLRFIRVRSLSSSAKDYLLEQGYREEVAKGILDAFLPNKPTASDVKGLGKDGLKSLSEAVEREIKAKRYSVTTIKVNFKVPHQHNEFTVEAPVGSTFYQLSKRDPDVGQYLECACSGNAACSTCHVIVQEDWFGKLPEPKEDELDMLDMAAGLTDTSRLGCQIRFTKELDGLTVTIPSEVNNLFK
jgi:ferredoxin